MRVWGMRSLPVWVVALGTAFGLLALLDGQTAGTATKSGAAATKGETEWKSFGSDSGATRYSPANQIDASNVKSLNVAWRFSTRNLGPRPATGMQVSPLIVDGVMYTTASATRDVVALDASTGQLLWHWRPTGDLLKWNDIIDPLASEIGRASCRERV